jgi:hypothetical protein
LLLAAVEASPALLTAIFPSVTVTEMMFQYMKRKMRQRKTDAKLILDLCVPAFDTAPLIGMAGCRSSLGAVEVACSSQNQHAF